MLENPGLPMTIADEILRKTSVEVPEESDIFLSTFVPLFALDFEMMPFLKKSRKK